MAKPKYDDTYVMRKKRSNNPRRKGSHGYWNWEECYRDGMTQYEYLHQRYKRQPITHGRTHHRFTGPHSRHFYYDLRHGYIEMVRR